MCTRLPCCRRALRGDAVEDRNSRTGYDAAQIGLVEFVKASKMTKPQAGHFAKTERRSGEDIQQEVAIEVPKAPAEGAGTTVSRRAIGCWWTSSPKTSLWTLSAARRPWLCRRCAAPRFRRRAQIARTYVPGAGLDWRLDLSVAGVSRPANARSHGRRIT